MQAECTFSPRLNTAKNNALLLRPTPSLELETGHAFNNSSARSLSAPSISPTQPGISKCSLKFCLKLFQCSERFIGACISRECCGLSAVNT